MKITFQAKNCAFLHCTTQITCTFISLSLLLAVGPKTVANDPLFGLDGRPSNLTCIAPERPQRNVAINLERAFPNLQLTTLRGQGTDANRLTAIAQLPGDNSRWYVVERGGRIHSFTNNDAVTELTTVLDISGHFSGIRNVQQWGINSLAFHPNFLSNGHLYIVYTDNEGPETQNISFLSRFTSSDGGLSFDPSTEEVILSIAQDIDFHHFGHLAFGPDGYLYISNGASTSVQDTYSLRGTLMRIDVDNGVPYSIPADNPFAVTGGAPEIFAWGFRNPWRFSFDRETGEIWIGDVGSVSWEEINLVEKGKNYGWPVMEGTHCYAEVACDPNGLTPPVHEYSHEVGRAVIGGYVYRGTRIPELNGVYIFADYSTAQIFGLFPDGNGNLNREALTEAGVQVNSFAEDSEGEIYVVSRDRSIYRLTPAVSDQPIADTFPTELSKTGCVDPAFPMGPAAGLIPYHVNTELWSDGAEKRRWMALPNGTTITIAPDGDFEFPIGTVLVKEFAFDGIPVETRLFMRHPDGSWAGYSYEWNTALTDATLLLSGKTKALDADTIWTYPSREQCMQCHNEEAGFVLGLEIAQLNGTFLYPSTNREANQLTTLEGIGMFTAGLPAQPENLPALTPQTDMTAPVTARARSYLHANCSICHRPDGLASSSIDFRFNVAVGAMNVCDAVPQHGDLGVAGARILFPTNPLLSVMSLRMHALSAERMPPLATAVVDPVGTSVVDAWIATPDVCAGLEIVTK